MMVSEGDNVGREREKENKGERIKERKGNEGRKCGYEQFLWIWEKWEK